MAGIPFVFTIARVAEILGEDEEWLREISTNMDPEEGHLWVIGIGDDVGVLDIEQTLVIHIVALTTQRAANHLLAQQLRPEGANADDMRHRVRVPALRQHRDRDDATDLLSEPAGLADRVHDLAKEIVIRESHLQNSSGVRDFSSRRG